MKYMYIPTGTYMYFTTYTLKLITSTVVILNSFKKRKLRYKI
jgi:hypothetical protein